MQFKITTATTMRKLGATIASVCKPSCVIYLHGELGAGKTTLVRGFLRKLGYAGRVHSPTFNLLEIYQVKKQIVCHFDLYRLRNPEELVYIGIRDYFNKNNICLIEWPENGEGFLKPADLLCNFAFGAKGHGRMVAIVAMSPLGEKIVKNFAKNNLAMQQ